MKVLGIESTAHTFGVGIIKDKKILANVKDSYTTIKGGIIPIQAKEHHLRVGQKVIDDALIKADLTLKDIDLISFSHSPGLAPCLMVGVKFAKELKQKTNLPVVAVNHCIAHLEISKMTSSAKDPVLLYASGANTQIIAFESAKYRIFGETLDQGIGNFLDSFARHIGLGFPGGPKIQEIASKSKNYIKLPYVVKGMDVSFAGILTNLKQKYDSKKYKIEDLCYSAQENVFSMLIEVSERAIAHTGKKELVLGGGVACNTRLKEMASLMCKQRDAKCFIPDNSLLVDNGVMIAYSGLLKYKSNKKEDKIDFDPNLRTDSIEVTWH